MCEFFRITKCLIFSFNIICLILAIIVIAINSLGLERSLPNTDEHTYFIMGIILGSLVSMTTLFGCYGIVCELIGVNVIYAIFILLLLVMQYLQMHSYPTRDFYRNAVDRLGHAWRLVDTQSFLMNTVEETYQCCGLYDSRDYNYRNLKIPKSCYSQKDIKVPTNLYTPGCLQALHDFYQYAIKREKFYNWSLFAAECVVFLGFCVFTISIYRQRRRASTQRDREIRRRQLTQNHSTSRTGLFSN